MSFPGFSFKTLPIVLIAALLPFFEGGETAQGLFLIHSLTLLALAVMIFSDLTVYVPRFLLFFLPFFGALFLSLVLAPYKFSAFLAFWDYCIAALFAICIYSLVRNRASQFRFSLAPLFFILTAATIATVIALNHFHDLRIRGSFINPNDFAFFCLLCVILGLFLLEQEKNLRIRLGLIAGILIMVGFFCFAFSRGASLAAGVFGLLYVAQKKPGKLLTLCIFAGLVIAASGLIYRFQQPDPFQYYRLKIWKHSLQGIMADPYLGIGLNMLQYDSTRFNFPADAELGRFARIARSADSQYLQILIETGFLGLFTFLIGWVSIYFLQRKPSPHFLALRHSVVVLSIVALFSLPLNNTAITFVFLLIVCLSLSVESDNRPVMLRPGKIKRLAAAVLLMIVFVFAVLFPFMADQEFSAALKAQDSSSARLHLNRAVFFNPYQPYYRFAFIRRLVDSNRNLNPDGLIYLVESINNCIKLHPAEPEFYVYRARVLRKLLQQKGDFNFYTQAISSYQAAIDKSPYNVFLRAEFAAFAAQAGRVNLAQSELQKALEAEPVFLQARLMLAQIKLQQNDLSGAREEFEKTEQYYRRYRNFVPVNNPGYVRQLLAVDVDRMKELRKSIYGT